MNDVNRRPVRLHLTAPGKSVKLSVMKTAVDIYKLLPKTNCGKCGLSSCFGYAAKLASQQASVDACPTMSPAARNALREEVASAAHRNVQGTVFEQSLKALQPKVQTLDFARLAGQFGAKLIGPDSLSITFLNEPFTVTKEHIVDPSGKEPLPFISILIYNHLCMPEPPAPLGEWITFSSVPASHAKDKAWAGHVEDVIAKRFDGDVDGLKAACERFGGKCASVSGNHDAAYEFRFFPHYPALLLFYDAVAEENFPAQCKLLLDETAPRYLDIESMVVLGEEFAGKLTEE
jgi:hypothetical protein